MNTFESFKSQVIEKANELNKEPLLDFSIERAYEEYSRAWPRVPNIEGLIDFIIEYQKD